MKINIYYGGRGMINDPTLYVLTKLTEVLTELRVEVGRYNLYELKKSITTLPQTLKDANGIILASTVEWHGIGGYMTQFLDACWLYGDKEKIAGMYMCPVVMSTTYGERSGMYELDTAWEILGGTPVEGICGYISDTVSLEMNRDYTRLIEKKAENLYRTISQKNLSLPASNTAIKQAVASNVNLELTPQESEQLSRYAADEGYVQRQKEDIQELASVFRGMLKTQEKDRILPFRKEFEEAFASAIGMDCVYRIKLEGDEKYIILHVKGNDMKYTYGNHENPDVDITLRPEILKEICQGRTTFQRAFMNGSIKSRGDFKLLRALDTVFEFI